MLCGTSTQPGALRTRVPAASSTLSNSPIVRDVLDNGLRILTERMTQVRSVSIGVWLTRGSRHETRRARRHRALRRAHALQGHRRPARPKTSPRRSIRSAASSTPSPRRNTPATTSRCSTSTCRWRSTSSPTSCAIRPSAPTTSSARRRSSSKRSRWSRTPPTIWSTSSSRRASGKTIRSAGRFSAPGNRRVVQRRPAARLFPATPTPPQNLIVSAVGNLEHDRVRELVEEKFGDRWRRSASRAGEQAPHGRAEDPDPQQGARAEPPVPRRQQLSAEPRRSLRQLRAEHAARRLDELAAVSERPREARAGLCGVQRPERLSRRRLVHDLRRLLERSGRRGHRSRRRGAARREAGAGAGRRAAAREGSPQGQPDAEPREHGEPHVAPGAAGDLLRSAVRPGRNAAGHRAGDAGRRAARGGRSVPERIAVGDGARQRQRLADSARAARSRTSRLDSHRYTPP